MRYAVGVLSITLAVAQVVGGQNPAPSLSTIRQLLLSGNFNDALAMSDALLKEQPSSPQLWLARAMSLRGLTRTRESLDSFDHVLVLKPEDLAALQGASEAAFLLKDHSAGSLNEKLLRLTPTDPVANAMAGSLAYERSDCVAAINYFTLGRPVLLGNPTGSLQFSQCLLTNGRADDAISLLEQVTTLTSDSTVSYDLAFALYSAARYGESATQLEKLKIRGQGGAEALDLLAAAYGKLDRVQDALDAYRDACDASPTVPEYYIDLVYFMMEHSSEIAAMKVLDTAIQRIPNSSELLTIRGAIYSFSGDPSKAEEDFKRAEEVDPASGFGVVGRSLSVRDQGKSSEAEAQLRNELRRQPNDVEAKYFLAEIIIDNDTASNHDEARRLLEEVLKKRPNDPNVLLVLATTYLEAKDPKAALPLLIHARQLDPQSAPILNRLLQVYRSLGLKDEAIKMANELRQIVNEDREAEAHRNRFHIAAVSSEPSVDQQR